MYCINLLIVLGPHGAVKIDPKVSVLLHFTNFLVKIRLPHPVQAKLNLNTIYRHWIDVAVHTCFGTFESIISISVELNVWFRYQYSHWSTFCWYLGCSVFIPSNFY